MLLVHFLLQNGVGQNLTAGAIVFAAGVAWSRTKYWPLHALHTHLVALRVSHARLHARHSEHSEHLERLGQSLIEAHEKLDRLSADQGEAAPGTGRPQRP